ncbi:hypothetical protein ARMSODRAFT_1006487 [Armillaria solidipes]|uniref:Heterokaryon incompatibility domain-containing protein n=1 Tax=Armillaria solidipes TaxID=1076256 RepID=A0A2H3B7G3_9AGAR|nr:hypothetical protein ARMSODRAFT_1006487 [Armillaria solidipes]
MDIIKAFLYEKVGLVARFANQIYGKIITFVYGSEVRGNRCAAGSAGQEAIEVHSKSDSDPPILNEQTVVSQEPTSSIHSAADRGVDGSDRVLQMHTILSVPVADVAETTINLDSLATPCHFRLVDCAAFIDLNELKIIEYPDISFDIPTAIHSSPPSFAAISYPWRDLQLPPGTSNPSFSINGATHADPISIDVLRTACIAARKLSSCAYLWLDRLCILQTSKRDKNWQIQRMYRIYSACDICLVLPGGLVRLAGLAEPTSWADRAWTLQEAVAPGKGKVKCLFKYTHASFQDFLDDECPEGAQYGFNLRGLSEVVEIVIEVGHSAVCDMSSLCFNLWSGIGQFEFDKPDIWEQRDKFPVRIIDPATTELLDLPLEMERGRRSPFSLWTSMYTRTSSRPVDMIFSLMDLYVSQFGPNDRVKATIKLIQELMRFQGGVAYWLYIAPWIKPSREISTLPEMPETSVSGRAYIQTGKGKVLALDAISADSEWNTWGMPSPAPVGKMTDSGYFVFFAKAVLVRVQAQEHSGGAARERENMMKAYDNHETWAIVVGRIRNWNRDPNT